MLLVNATLFLFFVGLLIYFSVQLVKNSYLNQLDSIKSGIIGQNTKLVEAFVKSQDALLEEKSDFILEEVKYLSLTFETSCVKARYPTLEFIGENLSCVNDVATNYINNISFIDSEKNIEISLKEDGTTTIEPFVSIYTKLWSSNDAYKTKVVRGDKVSKFYIIQPLEGYPDMALKFELNLGIFAKSLSFEGLDSFQYRFLLVDGDGNYIASNWSMSFQYFHHSYIFFDDRKIALKNYIISDDANSFTVTAANKENFKVIHRKNKSMGWRMVLIIPESYLHSSFVSTRNLLLSSDNLLMEKITISSLVLFILFLALIYITVLGTFRPINALIAQANSLRDQDFNKAMDVVYHNGDEIEVLSQAYSEAGRRIKVLVEGLEKEVKVRTDQYEKAAQEALSATKKKSTLLSNVSHEIRTPLNAIIGYSHMLIKSKSSEVYKYELDGIKNASNTILDIVNDLLDFERLDSVNYTLHPKNISINKIIRDVEKTFLPLASQKGIGLSVSKEGLANGSQLYVDELRFQQALSNIISNALKFTDSGGQINVMVSRQVVDDLRMVVFSIQDTGRGIREEDLSTIFKSFEQSNQEDKQFGFGLGLAITKAIITLMEGTVTVESKIGKGSTFKILLPINLLTHSSLLFDFEEDQDIPDDQEVEVLSYEGMKALVVDDVEFNREILQYHLSEQGIICVTANDGIEALAKTKTERFDVILTDVSMPNMDGVELANRMRKLVPTVPIIAVTARATVQEEERMRHNFDNYITKPVSEVELKKALSLTLKK